MRAYRLRTSPAPEDWRPYASRRTCCLCEPEDLLPNASLLPSDLPDASLRTDRMRTCLRTGQMRACRPACGPACSKGLATLCWQEDRLPDASLRSSLMLACGPA